MKTDSTAPQEPAGAGSSPSAGSGFVGHWTPVTEKMPDDEITVLVWVSTLDDATLAYHCSEVLAKRGDSGWILAGHARAERVLLGVTHWCGDISPPNVATEATASTKL